jgi:MtfA peptidase
MIFSWLKRRRRQRILACEFPADWLAHLNHNVVQYRLLTAPEQAKLRQRVQVFVAEKNWLGCGGLVVADEMKVTIAAQACLLVLGIDYEYHYDQIRSVLIYPDTYLHPPSDQDGLAHNGYPVYGEAWHRGPIVLSWKNTRALADEEGGNLVFHEFAHHLDDLDGGMDGTPPLERAHQRQWEHVIEKEYRRLVRASLQGRPTLLNEYGASSRAEFFAVGTECFFERPVALRERHPDLYAILRDFYRQDPATWPWEISETSKAASEPSEAIEADPADTPVTRVGFRKGTTDAYFTEGIWLMSERRYDDAVAAFDKAIEMAPRDTEALIHRALALIKAGQFERGIEGATSAIGLDDNDAMAWRVRATGYLAIAQYGRARADCRRAIELDGKNGEAFRLRGLALAGLGELKEALNDFGRAIHFDADLADTLRARAQTYERLGQFDKAQADREKAMRLDIASTDRRDVQRARSPMFRGSVKP